MKCTQCSAQLDKKSTTGADRLPRGWKKLPGDPPVVFCGKCWKTLYHLRAITFPLAGPLNRDDWPALREALAGVWGKTTMLANWIVTELAKADKIRTPDMEKIPPFKAPYLYPHARKVCPDLDPQSVVALLNTVQANYFKRRLDTVWRGSASLQNYRYPVPFPIPAQGWSARYLTETEHVPIVRTRIGGQSFDLRLRGGPSFYRQLADFEKIIHKTAIPCEMAIYRQTSHASDHRPGLKDREGGQSVQQTVIIKLVAWLPKAVLKAKENTMLVRTEKDRFLVADPEGAHPWILNAEQVIRWQVEHSRRRQHMSEDKKYEKRWPARNGQQMQDRLTQWVDKHKRRMDTWCHQTSAALVGYAVRQKVTTLVYQDSEVLTADFPWFKLRELIRQKLNEHNIVFQHASAKKTKATGETLAEGELKP
jgi:hypothetical protein